MKKLLITGVAGFIGSNVAKRFRNEGYHVVGIDDLSGGCIENIPDGIEFIQGDLAEDSFVKGLPKNCEKILHLAGQSSGEMSFDDPIADLHKNAVSTLNLIRYGMDNGSERIVYASSMAIYGIVPDVAVTESQSSNPLSCYGVGKLAAENYLKIYQNHLPYVSLRMFNVYGPGQEMDNLRQGMVSIYLAQALASGKIEIKGSLERYRDYIFIDDVVEAWFRSTISTSFLNQELNVGTGIRTTVCELITLIETKISGTTHFISNPTQCDQNGIFADTNRLKSFLEIESFISLEEGLELFIQSLGSYSPS